MLAGLGLPPTAVPAVDRRLRDRFHVHGRPDAQGFEDGTVFDLGGRTVTVVHLPGHTAGHSGFLVEPDGFLFVGDRSVQDVVDHRPNVEAPHVEPVERRTAVRHLDRLTRAGRVTEGEPGVFRTSP